MPFRKGLLSATRSYWKVARAASAWFATCDCQCSKHKPAQPSASYPKLCLRCEIVEKENGTVVLGLPLHRSTRKARAWCGYVESHVGMQGGTRTADADAIRNDLERTDS
eukprot:1968312-Amphidinium_carterae.1